MNPEAKIIPLKPPLVSVHRSTKKIILKVKGEYLFIKSTDIIRCEAQGNYTMVYTRQHATYCLSKTLKVIEALLDQIYFIRIHHGHLVNINTIKRISADGLVTLFDGNEIPYSRRRKKHMIETMRECFSHTQPGRSSFICDMKTC